MFGVSLGFVQNLWQRYRQTGSVEPKAHGGGNPGKLVGHDALVEQLHQRQPDASLAERCEQVAAREISISQISPTEKLSIAQDMERKNFGGMGGVRLASDDTQRLTFTPTISHHPFRFGIDA